MTMIEPIVLIEVDATPRQGMTPKRKRVALERHEFRCGLCHVPFENADLIEYDHIVPLELGGSETAHNLWPLHQACHAKKTRADRKAIAKAARLQRDASPETRRRTKNPLRSRGFQRADPLKG